MKRILFMTAMVTSFHAFGQWSGGTDDASPIYRSGSVGIGTTSPSSKLSVNGISEVIINYANKIVDSDPADMISVRSPDKVSSLNLISNRADAGPLGGLVFTTARGWTDSHRNVAGIVGGRTGTEGYAGGYLAFWTKNNNGDIPREYMRLDHQGRLGIGTIAPVNNSMLDVEGGGINIGGTGNLGATLHIKESFGGFDRLTQIHPTLNDKPALNLMASRDAGGNYQWWSWGVLNNGIWAMQPSTSFEGQTGFFIDRNGRVGVATNSPDEALAVRGNIHTQEVRVDLTGAVAPDYVFEKDYNLLPLAELEVYINQNKHLPEIPSAKEMEENGLNLKEMNLILLKKVEELTLHLIEQQKHIAEQDKKIGELIKRK